MDVLRAAARDDLGIPHVQAYLGTLKVDDAKFGETVRNVHNGLVELTNEAFATSNEWILNWWPEFRIFMENYESITAGSPPFRELHTKLLFADLADIMEPLWEL